MLKIKFIKIGWYLVRDNKVISKCFEFEEQAYWYGVKNNIIRADEPYEVEAVKLQQIK